MLPSILPVRAPRRPASEPIRRGLARLGSDLTQPAPVAVGGAGANRWRRSGVGAVPAALGATDAELARLARRDVMSPMDRVRWNAVANPTAAGSARTGKVAELAAVAERLAAEARAELRKHPLPPPVPGKGEAPKRETEPDRGRAADRPAAEDEPTARAADSSSQRGDGAGDRDGPGPDATRRGGKPLAPDAPDDGGAPRPRRGGR